MFSRKKEKCPLCESLNISHKYQIDSYELKFDTDACSDCGFIFMNPPLTGDTIRSFYTEQYYSGRADYSYIDERRIMKYAAYVWDKRVEVIHRYVKEGRFLDVGASFGGLMESAERFFTAYGIEISGYSASHAAEKFGGRIHHGTLEDHPYSANFFSAITMIELIEHLENPLKAIEECYSLLADNGLLVIQTANMDGQQAKSMAGRYEYFMPGHLSYFSMSNLSQALRKTGFSKVKIFYPVEFGLLPKLQKSRGSFTKISDYANWYRIAKYHMLGKIHWNDFALKSSMVIYAFK
ncbi:MAG TPA: class I SAM-dependent methyltransferase [Spirochaetota bacterium]|nr:class I SAM-dependent methyltransferase [Spirochaetota bacterium]